MTEIARDILTGQTERHLQTMSESGDQLHTGVVDAFWSLQQRATREGFDLQIGSSFRSFERQLAIWNAKASGDRPVLDHDCQPLNMARLSPRDQVFAILRWSALPGVSRHHWGTDMDIWNRAAVPAGYRLQLTPAECENDGPFAPMHRWLDDQIGSGAIDFYRPYSEDRGGVAPERWHLSYRPLAQQFAAEMTLALLADTLEQIDIALKSTVLDNLDEIFERFVVIG